MRRNRAELDEFYSCSFSSESLGTLNRGASPKPGARGRSRADRGRLRDVEGRNASATIRRCATLARSAARYRQKVALRIRSTSVKLDHSATLEVVSSKKCRSAMKLDLGGADKTSEEGTAFARHEILPAQLRLTSLALALFFTIVCALRTAARGPRPDAEAAELHAKAQRVQDVIDDLRGRLSLSRDVMAAIVPLNPLMVSVLSPVEQRRRLSGGVRRGLPRLADRRRAARGGRARARARVDLHASSRTCRPSSSRTRSRCGW